MTVRLESSVEDERVARRHDLVAPYSTPWIGLLVRSGFRFVGRGARRARRRFQRAARRLAAGERSPAMRPQAETAARSCDRRRQLTEVTA